MSISCWSVGTRTSTTVPHRPPTSVPIFGRWVIIGSRASYKAWSAIDEDLSAAFCTVKGYPIRKVRVLGEMISEYGVLNLERSTVQVKESRRIRTIRQLREDVRRLRENPSKIEIEILLCRTRKKISSLSKTERHARKRMKDQEDNEIIHWKSLSLCSTTF